MENRSEKISKATATSVTVETTSVISETIELKNLRIQREELAKRLQNFDAKNTADRKEMVATIMRFDNVIQKAMDAGVLDAVPIVATPIEEKPDV